MPDMGIGSILGAVAGPVISGIMGGNASQQAAQTQAGAANQASALQQQMYQQTQQNLAPWLQGGNVALSALQKGLGLSGPGIGGSPSLTGSGPPGTMGTSFNPALLSDPAYYSAWQQIFGGPGMGDSTKMSAADLSGQLSGILGPDWMQAHTQQTQASGAGTPGFGSLTKPFSLADFQASPSYQFNLQQGQAAIDKSARSKGMAYAPQTLQDIGKYSQGVASNEFQNALANYTGNQQQVYNMLSGQSGAGQNAAVQQGGFAQNLGTQVGSNITGAGNVLAAGQVGQANALGGGLSSAYNNYLLQQILSQNQQPTYGSDFAANSGIAGIGGLGSYG